MNRYLLVLQAAVFIYSISGIAGKLASNYDFLSFGFIFFYGLEMAALVVYAIFWQQIIKKVNLSVAYANKATSIFWAMIWSFLLFKEKIGINNIIGVLIIFAGMLLVNKDV